MHTGLIQSMHFTEILHASFYHINTLVSYYFDPSGPPYLPLELTLINTTSQLYWNMLQPLFMSFIFMSHCLVLVIFYHFTCKICLHVHCPTLQMVSQREARDRMTHSKEGQCSFQHQVIIPFFLIYIFGGKAGFKKEMICRDVVSS